MIACSIHLVLSIFNNSPVANAPPPAAVKTSGTPKINKNAEKKDPFDALFGGILPPIKTATKTELKRLLRKGEEVYVL